jgi:hypothetical protein
MGEVRVTVRLTSATDEALVRRGMLTPAEVRTCPHMGAGVEYPDLDIPPRQKDGCGANSAF